jgi:ribosome-associated translation inhibitor RaiA
VPAPRDGGARSRRIGTRSDARRSGLAIRRGRERASGGPLHAVASIMPFPVDIRFRDMETSAALEDFARRWADKLARVHDRISSCEVVIERPHQSQRHGQMVHVRVTVDVPGHSIIVSHDPEIDGAHEDAYVAVRDAFRAARRQLEQPARRHVGTIESHIGR